MLQYLGVLLCEKERDRERPMWEAWNLVKQDVHNGSKISVKK